jgi:hypothetical protein
MKNKSLIIINLLIKNNLFFFFRINLQLNQCFDIFEKSYLSISLSRLSDPINLMFSSSTTKLLPTQQELENLIKVMIK